ncbi:MAG: lipocalin family protein [Pseudomonadota bacterium]
MPDGVEPVGDFDADRYLGKWYEIARLDHSFERGLSNVSAEYSLRDDGAIRVVNSGYDIEEGEFDSVEGVARFVGEENEAYLKVSFFGPFYGSYVVFELEREGYSYAFVSGFNTSFLWLLARETEVSEELRTEFLERAGELGFDISEVIWVDHSPPG